MIITVEAQKKIITTDEMLRRLVEQRIDFSPFELSFVQLGPRPVDATLDLKWENNAFRFVVESKPRSDSLQTLKLVVERVLWDAKSTARYPMVYLPYLSKASIRMLADAKVSGFDLCGNLFLLVPDQVYVERIGKPNRFPSSTPIKNVYQKNSSLVPRLFLLQPVFDTMTEIIRELIRRNGNLTQSTVSKVCKQLEEDLILEKSRSTKRKRTYLIQPEVLLERLAENYVPPTITRRLTAKLLVTEDELTKRLLEWSNNTNERIVRTGTASCLAYTIMAREKTISFYCTHVDRLLSDLNDTLEETKRFANIELLEASDQCVYFDMKANLYASPVQSYLELMQGDKRDRQAAETIVQNLLAKVQTTLEKRENS